MQILTGERQMILCGHTASFRQLCRTQVHEGDSVVDVGCSIGVSTHICHQSGATAVGIDISKAVLTQARASYPGIEYAPRTTLVRAD